MGTSVWSDVLEPGDVMHGDVEGTVRQAVLLSGLRGTQSGVACKHSPNGWTVQLPKIGGSPSVGAYTNS